MTETTETKRKAPNFEPSTDRKILGNYLAKRLVKDEEDFVSYAELSAAIGGRDVQGKARGLLGGARKDLMREHHILTTAVRGEGIRRSVDPAGCVDARVRHIHRTASRGVREATSVLQGNPDNEQRHALLTKVAQLSAIGQFTTTAATRQISGKISREHPEALALLPTLDAVRAQFGNGKGKS